MSWLTLFDEIIQFARKYDPFPFHVDDQAAQATVFRGLISSGWLTALVWLRLMHEAVFCYETTLGSPLCVHWLWPIQPSVNTPAFRSRFTSSDRQELVVGLPRPGRPDPEPPIRSMSFVFTEISWQFRWRFWPVRGLGTDPNCQGCQCLRTTG